MQEQSKITIGVAFSALVESVKSAKVNEVIHLKLISGLTPSGIAWRCGGLDVATLDNSTVIFSNAGFYVPVILGALQDNSYGITVTN